MDDKLLDTPPEETPGENTLAKTDTPPAQDPLVEEKPPGVFARFVLPLLSVLLVSAFPVLFLYLNNASEVGFGEIFEPLGVFCLASLLVFLLAMLIMPRHSLPKAALVTCLFMLVLQNYAYLEQAAQMISSRLKLWHILPVCLAAVLCLAFLIQRKLKPADSIKLNMIFSIAFAGLIALNAVMAVPDLVRAGGKKNEPASASAPVETLSDTPMPNIYWMIFDEYSTSEVMEKYYNYDTSAFTSLLTDKGFAVNTACYNESAETATIIGNYMNLAYVLNDDMPVIDRQSKWVNGPALQQARAHGYEITPINLASRFGLTPVVGASDSTETGTVEGASFKDLLYGQTAIKDFFSGISNAEINAVTDSLAYLQNPENYADHSRLTLSYMLAPHQPFYFAANGKLNPPSAFHDWANKDYYLGYYIYITNQITAIVNSITENDPTAIIILQSDHSARYLTNESGERIIESADKHHAFSAVYYKGEPISEIQGMSGVNVLRRVFSKLYGVDMPELEVPGYE